MYSDKDAKTFRQAFEAVRAAGEHRSKRSNSTGIGKTFEDAIGVLENNIDAPDLHGFEIKSQRALSESLVTLFTKSPTSERGVNSVLRKAYGTPDSEFPEIKVLHVSVFGDAWVKHSGGYEYILRLDDQRQNLHLDIREASTKKIVRNDVYWSYDSLRKKFSGKLKHLAFIQASTRHDNGVECFTFTKCTLYSGVTFEIFKDLIADGSIVFDIRVGAYKNPGSKQYGKTHDHGSGFRIKKERLKLLYPHHEMI